MNLAGGLARVLGRLLNHFVFIHLPRATKRARPLRRLVSYGQRQLVLLSERANTRTWTRARAYILLTSNCEPALAATWKRTSK